MRKSRFRDQPHLDNDHERGAREARGHAERRDRSGANDRHATGAGRHGRCPARGPTSRPVDMNQRERHEHDRDTKRDDGRIHDSFLIQ